MTRRPRLASLAMTCATLVAPATLATLAACDPTASGDVAAPRPDSSAAQLAFGVTHVLTTNGVRRAELRADTAAFDEAGTRVELRRVRLAFFTAAGDTTATATAPAARYDLRTGRVTAYGGVGVVARDGRRLTAPRVTYDASDGRLSSDTAYALSGTGGARTGVGFEADPALRALRAPQPAPRPTAGVRPRR